MLWLRIRTGGGHWLAVVQDKDRRQALACCVSGYGQEAGTGLLWLRIRTAVGHWLAVAQDKDRRQALACCGSG